MKIAALLVTAALAGGASAAAGAAPEFRAKVNTVRWDDLRFTYHAGCPVGLYQNERKELLCPCHQSTFAVYDAARPVFGPAATSLPQLPLDVDADGHVVAAGDLSGPPGPSYWNQQWLWKGNE